jgi:hypothetical protein
MIRPAQVLPRRSTVSASSLEAAQEAQEIANTATVIISDKKTVKMPPGVEGALNPKRAKVDAKVPQNYDPERIKAYFDANPGKVRRLSCLISSERAKIQFSHSRVWRLRA